MTKILIVDDDPEIRQTLVYILEEEGYEVVTAADGTEGVRVFENTDPDLVITDIFMPRQEGIQTIREILELRDDAKIIATSGGFTYLEGLENTDKSFYLHTAEKLGARDIIAKPFDVDDLIRRVKHCLESDGGPQQSRQRSA
jgi:DNA-binding response OmpR family regulator